MDSMDRMLFDLIGRIVTMGHRLGQLPFAWEFQTDQLSLAQNLFQRKVVPVLIALHILYNIMLFLLSIWTQSPKLLVILVEGIIIMLFIFHYVVYLTIVTYGSRLVIYVWNALLLHLRSMECKNKLTHIFLADWDCVVYIFLFELLLTRVHLHEN